MEGDNVERVPVLLRKRRFSVDHDATSAFGARKSGEREERETRSRRKSRRRERGTLRHWPPASGFTACFMTRAPLPLSPGPECPLLFNFV